MAIKAQASITLSSITDIQANYRYYLLQASTLSKPSKPTTYPPPATWNDTEPSYTSGSDNSLYFVDCTVFSDGTFSYSEVSLSSAYEAAKDALDAVNTNSEDLTAFQNAVNTTLEGLQGQIDGSIMTWFYEYVPTNENEPASEWTTTDLKNNHLGDLFYDTITGYCYRWQVQNNEYSWQRITDVDVTKALADAAKAQDTADDKRRVFVGMTSPTPPYDVGDLWAQGSTGELMKCKIAKTSGQSYSATDWEKASKYTDDTKAEEVQDNLDIVENTVSTLSTDFNVEKGKISALITKTDSIETDITNIEGDISAVETNVSTLTTGQSQLTQTVNGITQNVSEIQSEQTTINNNISGLQTSVNDLTETTSSLTTNLEGITATVSQHTSTLETVNGEITDLDDRMDTAESKITPDAIIQTVSSVYETKEDAEDLANRVTTAEAQIKTNADQIALRVTESEMNTAIDEIRVGGRNLLRHTGALPTTETMYGPDGISVVNNAGVLTETEDGLSLNFESSNSACMAVPLVYDGCINDGEEITLSFKYRGNITGPGAFYLIQRTTPNVSYQLQNELIADETNWHDFSETFSIANANARICYEALIFYGNAQYDDTKWIEIKHDSLKLEKGNKATDWSPAPEDTSNEIDRDLENATTEILQTAENVTIGILKGYTTQDDLDTYKHEIENLFISSDKGFEFRFQKLTDQLTAVENKVITQNGFIRFLGPDEGGPKIVIGTTDIGEESTPVRAEFTKEALIFYYSDQPVASFTTEALNVKNISVGIVDESGQVNGGQIRYGTDWATRLGRYVEGRGYNLNDNWIGG